MRSSGVWMVVVGLALSFGADDFGGVLMEESVLRAAG
jgi:2-iminoacetate synthase ThiH